MAVPRCVADLRAVIGGSLLLLPAVCAVVLNDRGEILLHRRVDSGEWSLLNGIWSYLTSEVLCPNGDRAQDVVTTFEQHESAYFRATGRAGAT